MRWRFCQGLTCASRAIASRSSTTWPPRAWCCATAPWRPSACHRPPIASRCGGSFTIFRPNPAAALLHSGRTNDALIQRLADAHDPGRELTLIVDRYLGAEQTEAPAGVNLRPIATASYLAVSDRVAEAAFAVDDRFQGKGLGSMLLERLAVIAAGHGFERFQASTLTDNTPMLEVFRDSGFEIRSKSSGGAVDLHLSLAPSAEGVRAAEERDRAATAASLRPMLAPRRSRSSARRAIPSSIGRRMLDALRRRRIQGPDLSGQPERRRDRRPASAIARRATLPRGIDLDGHRRAERSGSSPSSTTAPQRGSSRWS